MSESANLSPKQRAFVERYLQCHNATEAARLAGYSEKTARAIGAENLTKPDISGEISRRTAEIAVAANEVLLRLAGHARGSLAPFLRISEAGALSFDLASEVAQANIHLLKKAKMRVRTGGTGESAWVETSIELELYDAQAALVQLGRYHKLFTDKMEHSGEVGLDLPAELEAMIEKVYGEAAQDRRALPEAQDGALAILGGPLALYPIA